MTWEAALRMVLEDYRDRRFQWGEHDCFQFVRDYVLLRTDVDHGKFVSYRTEPQAMALIDQYGGVAGLVGHFLGGSKAVAEVGDVVVCHAENLHVPGITNGQYVWAFIDDRGLCRMRLNTIVAAWSV